MKKNFMDKTRQIVFISCICAVFFLTAGIGTTKIQEKSRDSEWIEDIEQLAQELPVKHKNLFFTLSKEDFRIQIETLKKNLPNLNDPEVVFSLACLVASIGDAHTRLNVIPRTAFPFTLYWFKEGIFVVNTEPEYERILYCQLKDINGFSIDEVNAILSRAVSHENQAQIKNALPYLMIQAEFLYGAKIIDFLESAVFTFQRGDERPFSLEISSKSMKEKFQPIVGPGDENELPFYRRNRGKAYSYFHLEEEKILYVLYNSCRPMKDKPFPDFVREVFSVIDRNEVHKLIVDLRNNGGGNSAIFHPMIKELEQRDNLNTKNTLFVVLGRNTFSSAVLNAVQLNNQTQATFIGEPTGGKPNHFGEVKLFLLKNSGLNVSYSTKYFTFAKEDTDSFYPDIRVELSFHDYINKKDPVLEKILAISQ